MRSVADELPQFRSVVEARQYTAMRLSDAVEHAPTRDFLLMNLIADDDGRVRWRLNLDALAVNLNNIIGFPDKILAANPTFERPTLFIYGGRSDYCSLDDHDYIRRHFPNVDFRAIHGAGHWVHAEKPNQFIDALTEFITTHES